MALKLLTPRQASALVGVSESTIRRWCDSGELEASKTSGGHRRIDRAVLLRLARDQGLAIVSMGPAATAGQGGRLPKRHELASRFYEQFSDASSDGQPSEFAQNVIERLGEAETLCDEVIAPTLHRIGEEWSSGEIPIHEEHAATQECLQALLAAHAQFPTQPGQLVAICAGLSDDPYAIAPTMCSLVLRSAGFRSVLLGTNSPPEEILGSAIKRGAAMIAVSITATPVSIAAIASLCENAEAHGIRVALGGQGLTADFRKQLRPDFFGDSMAHLVAYARRLAKTLEAQVATSSCGAI
tara:strand:+ start:64591 stop:65484 length:894 start_codon:yes stop_codon:yes gene_type:complete